MTWIYILSVGSANLERIFNITKSPLDSVVKVSSCAAAAAAATTAADIKLSEKMDTGKNI